ncbi:MAG TPA: peptidoglycan DD-metalloendopeptidase family protein [Micropepsaceae bacterium]|nr:peptidoglycan DD-metalloendopeptidase family protein [Micropepsaceae bacterium]
MTASVAVAVTWLSLEATPASTARAYEPRREQAALPYDLLLRLTGLHAVPAIAAEDSKELYRAAGLISPDITGPLDRMLAAEREAAKPQIETRTLKVDNGDTIAGMLQEAGVSKTDAAAVVAAMKPLIKAKQIHSGQTFKATFGSPNAMAATSQPQASQTAKADQDDEDTSPARRLLSLSFAPSVDHQINVHLAPEDGYFAEDVQKKLEGRYQHAGAMIDSSLYLAAIQAGIPANLVVEIIHMFSYEVDFQRDIHPGDEFEVFFNRYFTDEGRPAKAGDILAASMTLSGKKHLLYRFEMPGGDAEYFDTNGQSAKAMLMKTPVDGARISSGFGQRAHPILGYTRMHKGIDFAVPSGTPVMAAGSGTVIFAGPAGEYGNLVVINHGNNYATAYGHLSRFAEDIHKGAHVHQGDIVAFSGMTGLATGPHLHYEIRVGNSQVNPATVKLASGRKLEGDDLKAFFAEQAHIEQLVAATPVQSKLARAN